MDCAKPQNHNPSVKNGFDNAWDVLAPIGNQQKITPLKTAFQSPQSWLNYKSDFGEVVDRYRWEDGCIAEHVSLIFHSLMYSVSCCLGEKKVYVRLTINPSGTRARHSRQTSRTAVKVRKKET